MMEPQAEKEEVELYLRVRLRDWLDLLFGPVFRIRIQSGQWIVSGSKRAKITHKIFKTKFHVLKCWMFSF
jgi:hypothetical protein